MMKSLFMNFLREEEGQGMAEYGLILAAVAVVAVAAFVLLEGKITDLLTDVGNKLDNPS